MKKMCLEMINILDILHKKKIMLTKRNHFINK